MEAIERGYRLMLPGHPEELPPTGGTVVRWGWVFEVVEYEAVDGMLRVIGEALRRVEAGND